MIISSPKAKVNVSVAIFKELWRRIQRDFKIEQKLLAA
jgi:hypothetical protein